MRHDQRRNLAGKQVDESKRMNDTHENAIETDLAAEDYRSLLDERTFTRWRMSDIAQRGQISNAAWEQFALDTTRKYATFRAIPKVKAQPKQASSAEATEQGNEAASEIPLLYRSGGEQAGLLPMRSVY